MLIELESNNVVEVLAELINVKQMRSGQLNDNRLKLILQGFVCYGCFNHLK